MNMILQSRTLILAIIMTIISFNCAFAQDKVVVVPLFGTSKSSATEQVCCKIESTGTLIEAESNILCNPDISQTRKLSDGNYEVDFLDPLTDVRPKVKLATLDTQSGGSVAWMIGVSDRSGDESSVFVKVRNNDNNSVNSGFNLCLF